MIELLRPADKDAARASQGICQMARFCAQSGNLVEAETLLRNHISTSFNDAPALLLLSELLGRQGRLPEATMMLQRAAGVLPANNEIKLGLARLLDAQDHVETARAQLNAITGPLRHSFAVRALEASLLGKLGDHEGEIAIYQGLTCDSPDHPALWNSLGNALKYAGRTEESLVALRRAVKIRPSYGEAWWSLANVKTARFEASDLRAMRKALRGGVQDIDALHLHFALGKALEDRREYEHSFRHYAEGNRIRSAGFRPEQLVVTPFVDQAIASLDRSFFASVGTHGHPETGPIFVVGLQRSGSTLIEQIVASHPLIEGTTELLALQQLWGDLGKDAAREGKTVWEALAESNPARLKAIGEDYFARVKPFRRTDRPLFVDKLPANWMMVGLIRAVLPNARIIDARRHPMACGFSNFKQHYATGVAFAYSLQSIGRFYVDYLRLMQHFDEVQPGAIHHLLNERLVADPEGEIRRLLDFIQVPFDPACLDFHRTKRAVSTPSAEQVRRPINSDGLDAWRHYETWLDELKEALGPNLFDWDRTPA
ncbi:tetratricopeptide repeat-containing sulfotransferase family protein [Sphingomonas alba]|uniref:Sulfotransferase n=1 Tax=Sphingomonas alba TaxID=2908208 RepID=A0ABT0RPM2_9SPHN|nr:sulfotransferase [Sphingomonas alba]MCL6684435.1 sulfotransferase [Sphingomonas alba]